MPFHDALPADFLADGESMIVDVDGFPVGIANVGGEHCAFQSLCPHQGTKLGGAPVDTDGVITCPQHASKYDVRTGRCVQPDTLDGFDQDLMTFPTRVVDGVVQVAL
jgi:3-phenylpropionate/trans-cinnamate dioxygenase ferredoxin subunit